MAKTVFFVFLGNVKMGKILLLSHGVGKALKRLELR
jgi:hypothetical protein